MNDWEESESWHDDLMAWERFQDKLERIKETSTQPDAERCNNPVEQ